MKKTLIALVGGLAFVVVVIVGGTIYAKSKIESEIRTAFAEAEKSPSVESASPGTITVDLIGDKVVLQNAEATTNAAEMAALYPQLPEGITFSGTFTQRAQSITFSGVRDLVFGATTIKTLVARNITMDMALQETLSMASKAPVTIKLDGQMSAAQMTSQNIDLSVISADAQNAAFNMWYALQRYDMDTIEADFTTTVESQTPDAPTLPPMKAHYTAQSAYVEDMARNRIGAMGIKGIDIDMEAPTSGPADTAPKLRNITLSIGDMTAKDITMSDSMMVTAGDFYMNDFKLPLPENPDPRGQMVMALLGISEPALDLRINFAFDEADQSFSLAPLQLRLHNAGAVDVSVDISGLPSMELFQKLQKVEALPSGLAAEAERLALKQEAEAAFAKLAISSVSAGYKDEGALKTFLTAQAVKTKTDLPTMAKMYALQASSLVNATHGQGKANEIFQALQSFFTKPDELRLRLSSEKPVTFKELSAAFKVMGPMALGAFKLDVLSP